MTQPLRVLIVEDSEDDALLLELQLRQGGYVPAVRRVDTPAALVAALAEQRWDIVLSDFRLPGFDGLAALKTVRERAADVPFILVSGAVGEEQAVAAMKAGAHDFLVKDRLSRLVPAVDRELREAESRRQRRLANAVLRDSEERLRLVLHASGLGWWQWDFAADALVVDETVKTLFGLPIDAAVTFERVLDLTHPDDRPRLAERAAASRAQAGDYEVEARAVWPDGSIHWYFAKGRSYNGPGGKPSHAMGIAMDINERKATEEKLRRRAASLSLLSDIATHLLLDEHTESAIRGTIDKLARHLGMEVHFNYLVSDDGQYLRLNSCGGVDQPTRRALERLEFGEAVCGAVAQQRQRLVLEDVQHSTDPKAVSLRPLGLRAYVCHPLIARGRLIGTLSFGTRGRDRLSEEEYELLRTVCDQVAMALERNRLIAELEQRASDLAAAKTSAEQAKAAAEHANRAKDHFLAVLSHELRTPLTPVVMGVSMLQDRCDLDAAARETLDMVRRNAEMEARLIDDLLDVTRIARGKVELHKQLVELCTVIQRAVEVCKPDIEARRLHFGVDLGPKAPYWVEADVARLQQVFWNLLKNAIKFTPHGGCVGIRCRPGWGSGFGVQGSDAGTGAGVQGSEPLGQQFPQTSDTGPQTLNPEPRTLNPFVEVEVNDSGIGIEPEALARVFNAFEQAERSITRQFGGLGLGLAISKALVEMHGGKIEAHSAGRDKGATFRIQLPLAAPAGPETPPIAASPQRPVRPLRILMVEDHGVTAKMMQMLLTAEGHTVELAGDLATALELAGQRPFDLLLSDLGLPDGSGHNLLRQLRQ